MDAYEREMMGIRTPSVRTAASSDDLLDEVPMHMCQNFIAVAENVHPDVSFGGQDLWILPDGQLLWSTQVDVYSQSRQKLGDIAEGCGGQKFSQVNCAGFYRPHVILSDRTVYGSRFLYSLTFMADVSGPRYVYNVSADRCGEGKGIILHKSWIQKALSWLGMLAEIVSALPNTILFNRGCARCEIEFTKNSLACKDMVENTTAFCLDRFKIQLMIEVPIPQQAVAVLNETVTVTDVEANQTWTTHKYAREAMTADQWVFAAPSYGATGVGRVWRIDMLNCECSSLHASLKFEDVL